MEHSVDCRCLGLDGEPDYQCTCGLEVALDVIRMVRLFCDGKVSGAVLRAALKKYDETRAQRQAGGG